MIFLLRRLGTVGLWSLGMKDVDCDDTNNKTQSNSNNNNNNNNNNNTSIEIRIIIVIFWKKKEEVGKFVQKRRRGKFIVLMMIRGFS